MKDIRKALGLFLAALTVSLAVSGTVFSGKAYAASGPVIDGKDGWYFYSGDTTLSDYRGTNLFTPEQLEILRQRLIFTRDQLAARGIEFVVVLAPNKEHIYPEYMPDSCGAPAACTRIEQLRDYLKDDLRVVCPIEDLLRAKQEWPQYDYYFRTDTHWNDCGCYIAAQPLLAELGVPELPPLGEITVTQVSSNGGELASLSGRKLTDTTYFLSGYTDRNVLFDTDYASYMRYHTEGADPRKVMFYGDSFCMGLAGAISPQFNDVYAIYRGYEEPDLLGREEPDIVIYEALERFLDTLFTYPLIP